MKAPALLWMTPSALESLRQDLMRRGMELAPFYAAAGQVATADHIRATCKLLAWAPEAGVREVAGTLGQLFVNAAFMLPTAGQPGWSSTLEWMHAKTAIGAGL